MGLRPLNWWLLSALCLRTAFVTITGSSQTNPPAAVFWVAGSLESGFTNDIGREARFSTNIAGLATDSSGNLCVSNAGNRRIRKVSSDGTVITLAGSGLEGTTDGTKAESGDAGEYRVTVRNSTGSADRKFTVVVNGSLSLHAQLGAQGDLLVSVSPDDDVQFESSQDLYEWTPATPIQVIGEPPARHYRFDATEPF